MRMCLYWNLLVLEFACFVDGVEVHRFFLIRENGAIHWVEDYISG